MIVPESQKSETGAPSSSTRSETSLGMDVPPSPPPYSPTASSSNNPYQDSTQPAFKPLSSIRPNLPPRCNYFIDRKVFGGVKGTWHVDTALDIPERLLLSVDQFNGYWNREAQRTRKTWPDGVRKRQERTSDSKGALNPSVDTRPNLMLATINGAIGGDIHVMSSDGLVRQATLVAEGFNGAVTLKIHAPPEQPLRVFASTTNGSINIKVPTSFEGAVMMSTTWGSVNISEPIKAKLTTFSSASNTSRGFIGDWQASGFGTTANSSDSNPFATWTGPIIEMASTNGSVSLSYTEEGGISAYIDQFTKSIQGFVDNWFSGGQNESSPSLPPPMSLSPQPGVKPLPPKS
ncbi:unnamed protein product [Rhizoctonia solani]|uniref:DUF7330 domain-containing protein n=1 Tax=Rhizoctonia solani TaxID=456999 RepID=A0A8H3BRB0_9AGAM|nr:unnamed protein product [Rhizoctonia solani]